MRGGYDAIAVQERAASLSKHAVEGLGATPIVSVTTSDAGE
jgi:hypothetical protein